MPEIRRHYLRLVCILLLLFAVVGATARGQNPSSPENPKEKIGQLLHRLVSAPSDTCGGPRSADLDPDGIEQSILEESSNLFLQQLNQGGADLISSSEHAT